MRDLLVRLANTLSGKNTPPYTRISLILPFYILAPLAVYGGVSDFIPSPSWSATTGGVSSYVAVAFAGVYLFGIISKRLVLRTRDGRELSSGRKGLAYVVFTVTLWVGFQAAAEQGVGALITRIVGEPYAQKIQAQTSRTRARRGCDARASAPFFDAAFPSYLCISEAAFERNPSGSIGLNLRGLRSSLGFLITEF